MAVISLYILNKAGGLIYQKDFRPGLHKLSTNDYLVLAGTFHSVHAITTRISPTQGNSSGVVLLETSRYALHCFQTLTGIKFLVITDLHQFTIDNVVSRIYQLYSDYVMKNPFYQLDMPVRCEQFDRHLNSYLVSVP